MADVEFLKWVWVRKFHHYLLSLHQASPSKAIPFFYHSFHLADKPPILEPYIGKITYSLCPLYYFIRPDFSFPVAREKRIIPPLLSLRMLQLHRLSNLFL